LLARDLVGGFQALFAVLALEGVHYYNFSVPKFSHDQVQLPFWALTGLFFCRGLLRGRAADWLLAGVMLALAFWSKYAAFVLALSLLLFLLLDKRARRSLATAGPWLMALAFLLVIAPNLWWLVRTGFMPFTYVEEQAHVAAGWLDIVRFPLEWTGGQIVFLAPAIALVALVYAGRSPVAAAVDADARLARRLVTVLALGPFVLTTLIAIATSRHPLGRWGYPLWSFAPLAVMLWLGPVTEAARLRVAAAGILALLAGFPLLYAGAEVLEPLVRDRPKADQFPGRAVAAIVTDAWRKRFGTPLVYVAGREFPANTVAVYSPDHPHVVPHGDPKLAPWVDRADLARRGALVIWDERGPLPGWAATFPGLEPQPPIVLPRRVWVGGKGLAPVRVTYAFAPPRP
jgi:hypothetical protein